MNCFIVLFVSVYSLVKAAAETVAIKKLLSANKIFIILFDLFAVLLTSILLVGLFFAITPFIIFKSVVYLLLKIEHGKNFDGFIPGNCSQLIAYKEPCWIYALLVIEDDEDILKFYKHLKRVVEITQNLNYQLGSLIKHRFGYYYYLRNQIEPRNVIETIHLNQNEFITIEEILRYIDNWSERKKLWEVKLFKQPLVSDRANSNKYALVIKINHVICDGYNLVVLLKNYLLDKREKNNKIPLNPYERKLKKAFQLNNLTIDKNYYTSYDNNFSFAPTNYISTIYNEITPKYVEKIKEIKRKFNVSFTEVLLAALAHGFAKFSTDVKRKRLDGIKVYLPRRSEISDVRNMLNKSYEIQKLTNEFYILSYSVAIDKNYGNGEFLKRLHQEYDRAINSAGPVLSYAIPKYLLKFLPMSLYRKIIENSYKDLFICATNIAELDEGFILGRRIIDINGIVTTCGNCGLVLLFFTYNNCLKLTLIGQSEIFKTHADLDEIMKYLLEYVDSFSSI